MSRTHVRRILGGYAQQHPDEDFAEAFAVRRTPGFDWRPAFARWSALAELERIDAVMRNVSMELPSIAELSDDDVPDLKSSLIVKPLKEDASLGITSTRHHVDACRT